jgi:hypothetical protein
VRKGRKAFLWLATAFALVKILVFGLGLLSFGGGDGTFAFRTHQPGDPSTPVTFSSCKPVRVEINLDGVNEPEAAKRIVLSAMGEVSAASGLQLQYVGPTTRRPRWPDETLTIEGGAWPVLVAFATKQELPAMEGAIGLGGATIIDRGGVRSNVTGTVGIDTDYFNDMHGFRQGEKDKRATVMHELGHVLGLGHVQDNGDVMNKKGHRVTELGPGDRRGLALLGKGPCT